MSAINELGKGAGFKADFETILFALKYKDKKLTNEEILELLERVIEETKRGKL